jgi:hypothetical protein
MQLYSEILDAGGPAFGSILRHVRDSPNHGFLFHCTGVFPTSLKYVFDHNGYYSWEGSHWDSGCFTLVGESLAPS